MPSRDRECSDTRHASSRLRHLSAHGRRALLVPQLLLMALPAAAPAPSGATTSALSALPALWRDDQGQPFDLRSLEGHVVVLTMAYASCHRICPISISRLQQLQQDFDRHGTSAEFVIIGYDPESDDAATWHQYRASRHLTRGNWHFLVGTRPMVEQTARQLGFGFWKYDAHVMHDLRILHFDERGTLVAADDAALRQTPQSKPR
jgi:protein SCO1/2